MNKPFLKWAGNKFRVLPHLIPHIGYPKTYCEPFGGSLSVALNNVADKYILNDINKDLVAIYNNINTDGENFIQYCKELFIPTNNTKEVYLDIRSQFNNCTDMRERARIFVYLNRHCFNGLSRYNSKGGFNVPYGKYDSPKCPVDEMRFFHKYFEGKEVSFNSVSFEDESLYSSLGEGDVLYMDPPYVPATETANFTSYATEGFTHEQQVKLSNIAEELSSKGVKVIISNHDVPITRELYKNAKIYGIQVTRTISAKSSSRKKASELIAVYG